MSSTFSQSYTETFTLLHARQLASRVATDLQRLQRFYRAPSDNDIRNYEAELTHMLKHDIVDTVVYGFQRSGKWTEAALRYKALPGGTLVADDDPGKVRPGFDIASATFNSFLSYNRLWWAMPEDARQAIEAGLPFQRTTGDTPPLEAGYWSDDLNYLAGGRGLGRSTVRR